MVKTKSNIMMYSKEGRVKDEIDLLEEKIDATKINDLKDIVQKRQ